MIILPDRNVCHTKFLMPVPKKEWMIPSLIQPKDCFGKENRTYFFIEALTNDGKVCWTGRYEDRDDFDAVLWAIANNTLKFQKELWPLSTPTWDPWLGEIISYRYFITVNLTSPTGSNQTYRRPTDWRDYNSKIECIGAGGSGGASSGAGTASGGGGGGYSRILNFEFGSSTSATVTYQIGSGGTAIGTTVSVAPQQVNGNSGGSTWWNDTVFPGLGTDNTKCAASGGGPGLGSATTANGGAGGNDGLVAWGQTTFVGGRGGNATGTSKVGTGGGGAAGSSGNGNPGGDSATQNTGTNGGAGGAGDVGVGSAGAAGTGNSNASVGPAGNGGNGTNLSNGTVGTGGGGGGIYFGDRSTVTAGNGGNYGGGGGGANNGGGGNNVGTKANGGAGIAGLIIITYFPRRRSNMVST